MRGSRLLLTGLLAVTPSQLLPGQTTGSISGTVTAEDTGKGVPARVVTLPKGLAMFSTQAAPDGVFTIRDVPPGVYYVMFGEVEGYVPSGLAVELRPGAALTGVNHVLRRGGSVAGGVYQADGTTPLTGVLVSVRVLGVPEGVEDDYAKRVDPKGQFLLDGLPTSPDVVVSVAPLGHARVSAHVAIESGVTTSVTLIVKTGDVTGISGVVISGTDGQPREGAWVVLETPSGERVGEAETDATGLYAIRGVAPGRYTARATLENHGWTVRAGVLVEPGVASRVDFQLELRR